MKWGIYVPLAFSAWALIDVVTTSMASPGIGLFITLAASIALALIANKVIKLK